MIIYTGNIDTVRQLLTLQIVNIVDDNGLSALHWATENGNSLHFY